MDRLKEIVNPKSPERSSQMRVVRSLYFDTGSSKGIGARNSLRGMVYPDPPFPPNSGYDDTSLRVKECV